MPTYTFFKTDEEDHTGSYLWMSCVFAIFIMWRCWLRHHNERDDVLAVRNPQEYKDEAKQEEEIEITPSP
jgi:hypothetical protein